MDKLNGTNLGIRYEYYALALLIATVSLVNLVWIRLDTRPQPFMDAYPTQTLRFIDGVRKQGLAQLPQLVVKMSVGPRPPLYQLLAAPYMCLVERTVDAMLLVNVFFEVILLLFTYSMGKLAKSDKAGLLAALLVATYPPIVNLSKIARPHSAAPACVALSLWFLLRLLKTRSLKIAWLFGASLGFGFLIHPNLFYVLLAPSVIFGLYMVFFQAEPKWPHNTKQVLRWSLAKLRDPFVLKGLLPAGVIATGLTASWYLPRIHGITELMQGSAASWSNVRYGFPNIPPSFWWYALTMPGAISWVFTALLAVSLIVNIAKRRLYTSALAITFLLIYCGMSMRKGTKAWMNFAAALPVAAVLTAICVVDIYDLAFFTKTAPSLGKPRAILPFQPLVSTKHICRPLSSILLLVCIGVAVVNFSAVSWGIPPYGESVVRALGAPLDSTCAWRMNVAFCPNPPRNEHWPVSDILRTITTDPECKHRLCHLTVTRIAPDFNQAIFEYQLAQDFPEFRLSVSDTGGPLKQSYDLPGFLDSDYLVYGPQAPGNTYARATARFLESPPAAFVHAHQEVASLELPDGTAATLIKRTQPLTVEEAEASIAVLDLPPEAKSLVFAVLAPLYAEEGAVYKAIVLYQQALERSSDVRSQARYLVEIGDLYVELGDEEQAREAYAQAIELYPSYTKASLKLAQIEQQAGRPETAEEVLQSAKRHRPDSAQIHMQLGMAYQEMGLTQEAIAEYKKVVELNPEQVDAHIALGHAYKDAGTMSKAIAAYERAINLAPTRTGVRVRLAQAYRANDQPQDAIRELEAAISLAPDHPWPRQVLADAHRSLGQSDQAIILYRQALHIDPNHVASHCGLAQACQAQGDCQQAITHMAACTELHPAAWSYALLGDMYRECEDSDGAIAAYEQAIALNARHVRAHFGLAVAYDAQGRQAEAVREFQRVLEIAPGSEFAGQAQHSLDKY